MTYNPSMAVVKNINNVPLGGSGARQFWQRQLLQLNVYSEKKLRDKLSMRAQTGC